MIGFLLLLLHVLVSPLKTHARLEAEIVLLRHHVSVLRQRVPSKPRLTAADRLLFVWLYRLFPSVFNAMTIVQPETVMLTESLCSFRWWRIGSLPFGRPWQRRHVRSNWTVLMRLATP